jgi:hypothetical protein
MNGNFKYELIGRFEIFGLSSDLEHKPDLKNISWKKVKTLLSITLTGEICL